jgi:hypothetical protein
VRRPRFSRLSRHWRRALDLDRGLAGVEGLAAGTGLLTGDLARAAGTEVLPCPRCAGASEPVVIDLVAGLVVRSCLRCEHRWERSESLGGRPAR